MTTGRTSDRDHLVAARVLPEYGFSDRAELRIINLSENATFLVSDDDEDRSGILRVHRENYHDKSAIESELDWLDAISRDTDLRVSSVIAAPDGRRVMEVDQDSSIRYATLFEMMGGLEPDEASLCPADFHKLGEITATLHAHARQWTPPPGFDRFEWDWDHCLGAFPRWGRWEAGVGIGSEEIRRITPAVELMVRRLAEYGQSSHRYGLVHADLRLANLLVDGDRVNVIDFDDCGFGWFLYDWGTAVSFMEDDPQVPSWQEAWIDGYTRHGTLTSDDREMMATFVFFRRMMLTAWMGSHSHAAEVQAKGPDYARGTSAMAQRYLETGGLSVSEHDLR